MSAIRGAAALLIVANAAALTLSPLASVHAPGRAPTVPLRMAVDAPVKIPEKAPIINPGKPADDQDTDPGKKYKLMLFNDNVNRREYVARVLVSNIPELSQSDAYIIMQRAHKSGMAVVGIWLFELAEAYCERLRLGGLIATVTEED